MKGKALKKMAADIRRNVSREHGFRQSAYINFKVDGDYFFCLYFFANGTEFPNEAKLTVKPMYADTLWWNIWDTPECINAPISLRGTGAYALSGMVLAKYKNLIDPKESGDSEMKDLYEHIFSQAETEISRFISNNPDADTFYPDETKMDYDPDRLLYLIALIHNKQEDEALLIIKEARSNKHHCVFRSGWNSDSYTCIKRWCNRGRTAERIRHRIDNMFNAVIRFRAFFIMSISRDRRYGLPDIWTCRFLDGVVYMAILFSWIFLMKNFTMAWISLAILAILQFMVDGKRTKRYYREFMNLPLTARRKWTLGAWSVTVALWVYVIFLIIKPLKQ